MKHHSTDGEFLEALLAQEPTLRSPAFDDSRRQLLVRLARAERRERSARWITLSAVVLAGAPFTLLYATHMGEMAPGSHWPEWAAKLAILSVLLCPILALLLAGIYLIGHRRELRRARKAVHREAFAEAIRQIGELRKLMAPAPPLPSAEKAATAKPPESGQAGFTLVELLVVTALLGILAGLLLPAVSRGKGRARAAACAGHLSQLGRGLAMYVSSSHKFPGTRGSVIRPDNPGLSNPQPFNSPWVLWNDQLAPYVSGDARVFLCPSHQPWTPPGNSWTNQSYGYNSYGSGLNGPLQNLGLGRIQPPDNLIASPMMEVSESALRAPADMVALADLVDFPSVNSAVVTPGRKYSDPAERHQSGANAVFCDGHLEWAKAADWNQPTEAARRRWNNDHEPHPETW